MPFFIPIHDLRSARAGQRSPAATLRRPPSRSNATLFAPLQALLSGRWMLQRRGFGLRVLLAHPATAADPEAIPPSRGAALRHDHRRLSQWLRDHADLCHSLRHLVCVEQTLARQGSRALRTMPEKVLRKALEQLQGLTRDDPGFVLPELLRRLQHTVTTVSGPVSRFELTEAMDVSEASHSLFDEMERSWNGRIPAAK